MKLKLHLFNLFYFMRFCHARSPFSPSPHVRFVTSLPALPILMEKGGGRGWLCQHQGPSLASLEVLAFWEYPVPTALTARLARRLNRGGLVGIIPFPGQ